MIRFVFHSAFDSVSVKSLDSSVESNRQLLTSCVFFLETPKNIGRYAGSFNISEMMLKAVLNTI